MDNTVNVVKQNDPQVQFESVFEALQKRNFDKAAKLVPEGYKLCGYQEFTEPFVYEQYGYGWAGQFEHTKVAPGLYPVFCREYYFNECENAFTNTVKDYPGICLWYKGILVASSDGDISRSNTVFANLYAHSVAKDILAQKSKIHLLAPFKAVEVPFEYDGEMHTTYHIIDTSIPSLIKENPMTLNRPSLTIPLDKQIQHSKTQLSTTHTPLTPRNKPNLER